MNSINSKQVINRLTLALLLSLFVSTTQARFALVDLLTLNELLDVKEPTNQEVDSSSLNSLTDYLGAFQINAHEPDTSDRFGFSVAVYGDTMVVGASSEDSNAVGVNNDATNNDAPNSGAAYVYVFENGIWNLQAYLKASNAESSDQFGVAVDIFQDTIVIGARFEKSNATGIDGNQLDNSADRTGAAYIFTRNNGIWSQQAYIKASNSGEHDWFGEPVAIYENTLAIGAVNEDSNSTGVDGDQNNDLATNSGAVYVFTRNGTSWSQQSYIKAFNTDFGDSFGQSVDIDNMTLLVGAIKEDSDSIITNGVDNDLSENSGAVYLFNRNINTWIQHSYFKAFNNDENDEFGTSVSLLNNEIVIGAVYEDSSATGINGNGFDDLAPDSGAAYYYRKIVNDWVFQGYIKASNTQSNDYFGFKVSLSNKTLLVGAFGEDSNATNINGDETNNDSLSAGAAYLYKRPATPIIWYQDAYLKSSVNPNDGDFFSYSIALTNKHIIAGAQFYQSATGAVYSFIIDHLFNDGFE